jgi:NAD(P)-dependent dehydrogenase (short-subunit alcohol dehydrogenase family)
MHQSRYTTVATPYESASLHQETTEENFMKTLRVNTLGAPDCCIWPADPLAGPFFAIKHASPVIAANDDGGCIVCTASIAAIRADVTPLEYAASKGALVSLGS